jgi:CXXC-20-CXXC protein
LRDLLFFTRRKKCPVCDKTQHITKESNWKRGVLGVPLPLVPITLNLFNVPWLWAGVITFLLIMVYFTFVPYQLEFTNEEQPLF